MVLSDAQGDATPELEPRLKLAGQLLGISPAPPPGRRTPHAR